MKIAIINGSPKGGAEQHHPSEHKNLEKLYPTHEFRRLVLGFYSFGVKNDDSITKIRRLL